MGRAVARASGWSFAFVVLATACSSAAPRTAPRTEPLPNELRAPAAFDVIADPSDRSRALFTEASRVLLHPRCVNCHPSDDSPRQRDGLPHDPPVTRGDDDRGVPAMGCTSCHQESNVELARVPGAPGWHLAPKSMAWAGRSLASICEQVKDPVRNGHKTLAQIVDHAAHDKLVAWGWKPGEGRSSAPGTQAEFGALVAAWVATGAACPEEVHR